MTADMGITADEMQTVIDDLVTLSERKNLNKQHRESASKAAAMIKEAAALLKELAGGGVAVGQEAEPAEEKPREEPACEYVEVEVVIPGAPGRKMVMEKHSAENMAAAFWQGNRPIFACNLPEAYRQFGGLYEVDLRQVACIISPGLRVQEAEEPFRPDTSHKKRSRAHGWHRGNVTCHNCGADYETDINEKWTFVRCKYCHETDTTVTEPDD